MEKEIHFPKIKESTPKAPRMTMDEYYKFVMYNLEHVIDRNRLEDQIMQEKRMKYTLFQI